MKWLGAVALLAFGGVGLWWSRRQKDATADGVPPSDGDTPMLVNQRGIDLIESLEGRELEAYQDEKGIWTIGVGHTPAYEGQTITPEEADQLLQQDLVSAERAVANTLQAPATPNQFAAMVSLTFNIGGGEFSTSTVARKFNGGDLAGAADAFRLFNKVRINGQLQVSANLVQRRERERELFLTDDAGVA